MELPVRTNHIPSHIPKHLFETSPRFCILSVALCHFVLEHGVLLHYVFFDNISSIVSSVPLLTQALDLLGEISWDELRAPSG